MNILGILRTYMDILNKAYALAKEVRLKAHAPYSRFLVGAVVKAKGSDQLFAACNVENASYGGAVCAERNAIFQMVANLGTSEAEFLVLVTDTPTGAAPCGFCLQVLSEFCAPEFPVHLTNLEGFKKKYLLKELLPLMFDKKDLPK